jgi:hypothetical protein
MPLSHSLLTVTQVAREALLPASYELYRTASCMCGGSGVMAI